MDINQLLRFVGSKGAINCRNTAFQNLGIVEQKRHKIPHVTMLKKHGKRLLENADDLTSQLKRKFKGAKFEIVEGKAIATMSLKEQVRLFPPCFSFSCS